MGEVSVLYRAKPLWVFWYAVSRLLPVCLVAVFAVSCFHGGEESSLPTLRHVLLPCIGIPVGALLGALLARFDHRGVISITDTTVQGPKSLSTFHQRQNLLIADVDLSKCRRMGRLLSGRIVTCAGESVVVSPIFFSFQQASEMFATLEAHKVQRRVCP